MKQLNNGYSANYYLTEEGELYNAITDKYTKPNGKHYFSLKTIENTYKNVSLKTLYKLVYGKNFCIDNIEDLPEEEWKAIKGTDNLYFCSTLGRIKSLRGYEAIILNPYRTKYGYDRVDIIQNGSRSSKLVHRLVASCWLPAPTDLDQQIHHKDFCKSNNRKDNLQWLSSTEHSKLHEKERKNGTKKDSNR